jgi:arylsulfatase
MRLLACLLSVVCVLALSNAGAATPPNVVIIFADDMGYGDVGCYGARDLATPHLDRLAAEGVKFTRFYVSQPVCSASRASLLTGCYANRVSIYGALSPRAQVGLHPQEVTLAEVLKTRGYATAAIGKWHLGDQPEFLPTRQGFDTYFGLPYSNDMWPYHPEYADAPPDSPRRKAGYPDLPLYENERVKLAPVTAEHQARLTTWYTERAVQFIEQNRRRPFFLYLAHSMPHVPLFVSEKFKGRSGRGLYGDVIMEIDWSVGQILAALERHRLAERTLVIFTSDNGPWLSYGNHAGSAGGLREGKGTVWEGGVRVPCLMRWPGKIPAGTVCAQPAMTLDLLPTLARLAGAALPTNKLDGKDIWPLMAGHPGAVSPQEAYYFYYQQNELQALTSGPWKLILPHTYRTMEGQPPGRDGKPGPYRNVKLAQPELYHLEKDPAETTNVAAAHPEVMARLLALAERARAELGDALTGRQGTEVRPPGRVRAAASTAPKP